MTGTTAASAENPVGPAQAVLFVDRALNSDESSQRNTKAKFEPASGCYIGAYVDFDPMLPNEARDSNGKMHKSSDRFDSIVGKPHSVWSTYLGYGRRLPLDWVTQAGKRGGFVQIALEPNNGLSPVKDDAYLQGLADDMARSGAKIFLRFASEMNGKWTNYWSDPAEFRRKFRLVHDVMQTRAPNVAMVWCPYTFSGHNMTSYYPGDDATDWVGVNMYCVTQHRDSGSMAVVEEHPCDLLAPIYTAYASRKPIMICEFAATHFSLVDGHQHSEFAARKILSLYAALPRIYPRVKCVNYFDANAMQYTPERSFVDYSICDNADVLAAYRKAISPAYFLGQSESGSDELVAIQPMPIHNGNLLTGTVHLSCWARTPSDRLVVRYKVDGEIVHRATTPAQWDFYWNTGAMESGPKTLELDVLRADGSLAVSQKVRVMTLSKRAAKKMASSSQYNISQRNVR